MAFVCLSLTLSGSSSRLQNPRLATPLFTKFSVASKPHRISTPSTSSKSFDTCAPPHECRHSPISCATTSDLNKISGHTGQVGYFSTAPECPTPISLPVSGNIPSYVNGTLYRNGPCIYETPHADATVTARRYWFDCIAMLHRFQVDGKNNSVTFNSRISAPAELRAAASVPKHQYNPGIIFGVQDPYKSFFAKLSTMFLPRGGATKDPETAHSDPQNAVVTIEYIPGQGVVARSDFATMAKFDRETLEVRDFLKWSAIDVVPGTSKWELRGFMSAAHGQYDVATDEYYNYSSAMLGPSAGIYKIICINASGKVEVIASFRERCSYIHSLALTENYVILVVCPLRLDAIRSVFNKALMTGMEFKDDEETKFYVISRREKRVSAVFSSEPFWMFHTVNSFENDETGDIQVDICRYENADLIWQTSVEHMRTQPIQFFAKPFLTRYTLAGVRQAPRTNSGNNEILSQPPLRTVGRSLNDIISVELPQFNEKFHMQPYRYVYGVHWGTRSQASGLAASGDGDENENEKFLFRKLVKIDLSNPANSKMWMEAGMCVGEAIFVGDPDGSEEDDGVLCVIAYNSTDGSSALIFLDAKHMTEVARAHCSIAIPAGCHGSFVSTTV